jgi:uncharacterized protein (DUF1778 family)
MASRRRHRTPPKQARVERLTVYLSFDELDLIREAAEADQRDASEWVRINVLRVAEIQRSKR